MCIPGGERNAHGHFRVFRTFCGKILVYSAVNLPVRYRRKRLYFDSLTVSAVRDELAERLLGGRVQRLVQPAELTVGLEIYAGYRYQLLLSAESQSPGRCWCRINCGEAWILPHPFINSW